MKVKNKNYLFAVITGLVVGVVMKYTIIISGGNNETALIVSFLSATTILMIDWKYRNLVSVLDLLGQKVHNIETNHFYKRDDEDDINEILE